MKAEIANRQIQILATLLAGVSSYYAIRASLQLPRFSSELYLLRPTTPNSVEVK